MCAGCVQEDLFHFNSIFLIRDVCGLIFISHSIGNDFNLQYIKSW